MTLHKFKMITKPFWIPIITAIYVFNTKQINYLIISALFFGWIGDLLLMRGRKKWFIAGAFSFLVGHVFYITVFLISAGGFIVFAEHALICHLFLLPYFGYMYFMNRFLGQNVKSVFVPMVLYLSLLLLMSYSSLLRFWNVPLHSFLLTYLGSILFIISDSLIAVRKFKNKFSGIGIVIVVTYISAQIMIICGLL